MPHPMRRRIQRSSSAVEAPGSASKSRRVDPAPPLLQEECGDGSSKNPFWLPLREAQNESGCFFCPSQTCHCQWLAHTFSECYASLSSQRQVETSRRRELCAKSVLPPFVSRLIRAANIQSNEVFYDFGCGNGSVLFQVAAMTGCRCVGVEINAHNASVATQAWKVLQPQLERKFHRQLEVEIICADMCDVMRPPTFFGTSPCVIWAANLLLPRPVNHYLSVRLRSVPRGTRIFCFEDLYPHGRSLAKLRDPDAFERFEMIDYRWQPGTVEWCVMSGSFYLYVKKTDEAASAEEKAVK